MLFNSFEFIFLFFPITLLIFFSLAKGRYVPALNFIALSSIVFYGWWNPIYLMLFVFSVIINYFVAERIWCAEEKGFFSKKSILIFGILLNLSILLYFKYAAFFLDIFNSIFHTHYTITRYGIGYIALPLGISFYTFQKIAYLVDTYKGEADRYTFSEYMAFITFFPHLLAGPIVHHRALIHQFRNHLCEGFNSVHCVLGLTIFSFGLFKKVVFADTVGVYSNLYFDALGSGITPTFIETWIGVLSYTLQIYFDFSGYSEMAMGLALFFNVRIPVNFNSPYKSSSLIEFWRRWHMTLSAFLRDYVYIPLGGNRYGEGRRYINLLATMLIGGLWHGAGWTFLVWGALHGSGLAVNHLWRTLKSSWGWKTDSQFLSRGFSRASTFLLVVVGWVFFRARSLSDAKLVLLSMFGSFGISLPKSLELMGQKLPAFSHFFQFNGLAYNEIFHGKSLFEMVSVIVCLLSLAFFAPNVLEFVPYHANKVADIIGKEKPGFRWRPTWTWAAACAALSILALLGISRTNQFLYFDF